MTSYARISRGIGRRNPHPLPPLMRANIAEIDPGVINDQHLGVVGSTALTLEKVAQVALSPQTGNFTAGSQTATPQTWGAPPSADRLALRVGPTDTPFLLLAWASVSWSNSSGVDFLGKMVFSLFDGPVGNLGSGGVLYQRSMVGPATLIPAGGSFYQLALSDLLTIPTRDGADWHLALSFQTNGVSRAGQTLVRQRITAFSAGPSGVDPTTAADGVDA